MNKFNPKQEYLVDIESISRTLRSLSKEQTIKKNMKGLKMSFLRLYATIKSLFRVAINASNVVTWSMGRFLSQF